MLPLMGDGRRTLAGWPQALLCRRSLLTETRVGVVGVADSGHDGPLRRPYVTLLEGVQENPHAVIQVTLQQDAAEKGVRTRQDAACSDLHRLAAAHVDLDLHGHNGGGAHRRQALGKAGVAYEYYRALFAVMVSITAMLPHA
jgi:hypothetical protein